MTIGKNLKVNLFASEKKFPELAKPVQMSFDAKGRLWVAVLADLSALEAQGRITTTPDPGRHRRRRQGRRAVRNIPETRLKTGAGGARHNVFAIVAI